MKSVSLLLMLIISEVNIAQNYYLIAGTYTKWEKSDGIYIYKFDSKTGTARLVSSVYTENPSFLAIPADGRHLYSVNENANGKGGVSAFTFDHENGTLKFINQQLTHGDDPCYLRIDPTNKWIVAANYTGGNFSIFPIHPDGALGPAVQIIQHSGSSVNKDRQEMAHLHCVEFSYDRHYLAAVDLGMDQITLYPFDAGKEKPVTDKPFIINTPPGSGPRHFIFNPSKPLAYLIDELAANITVYRYSEGKIDSIQVISSQPADYKGEKGSAAIHFSADGKFLYGSNRGESNSISIFAVDDRSGRLTSVGFQSTGGEHPRDFTIDPSGKFLLAGNMKSGYVSIFDRDPGTGLLKDSGHKIRIPEPAQLLFTHIK